MKSKTSMRLLDLSAIIIDKAFDRGRSLCLRLSFYHKNIDRHIVYGLKWLGGALFGALLVEIAKDNIVNYFARFDALKI